MALETYRLSHRDAEVHIPEYPDLTGYRASPRYVEYKVWPARAALLKTIELEEGRAAKSTDWRDWYTSNMAKRIYHSARHLKNW